MSEPTITEITTGLQFPEGPVWMPDGTVCVVELKGACITRVFPDGRKETVAEPGGSPNGMAIGPDGALYVCNSGGWDFYEIGDFTIPQTELPAHHSGGRIERIDVDHPDPGKTYAVPPDNPFVAMKGARPEIWAYGMRNPWRIERQTCTTSSDGTRASSAVNALSTVEPIRMSAFIADSSCASAVPGADGV